MQAGAGEKLAACLVLAASTPAAAISFVSNEATAFTSVAATNRTATSQDTTDGPTDAMVGSAVALGSPAQAFAESTITEPSADRLGYSATSRVTLRRSTARSTIASGFAGLEPDQAFTFIAPGPGLTLTYTAEGTAAVTGETAGNSSSVRFSLVVRDDASGQVLFRDDAFSRDAYERASSTVLNVRGGQLLRVQVGNAASGSLDDSELAGDILATLELSFVIPEPASLAALLPAAALLPCRRRPRPA